MERTDRPGGSRGEPRQILTLPELPAQDAPQPGAHAASKTSYREILRSTALVGGSSVLNVGFGLFRTKAVALFLGPAGFGLMGLYGSISDLALSVAGLGVSSSAVRQIAEAAGSGDDEQLAWTVAVVRQVTIALGILSVVGLAALSVPASELTFGTRERAGGVALLSAAVFLRIVYGGQAALIQGTRRIADLARMNVLGSVGGTLATIPFIYWFRERGIVPSLIAVAAAALLVSWWYSRSIPIRRVAFNAREAWRQSSALLKLGSAFMGSGLMMTGSAYVVRTMILRHSGAEATGLYQAAWTIGGLYVGFILQAMGADFYPRLTVASKDTGECNRLVNEQARVGMLLAGPGILATITFAPLVISLLYSSNFMNAVETLRWISLGIALRVITWPMGYIILARGEQGLFFGTELAWTVLNAGLTWTLIQSHGIAGAGVGFFAAYVGQGTIIYCVVRRLTGFRWSDESFRTSQMLLAVITCVLGSFYVLPLYVAVAFGTAVVSAATVYSARSLVLLVGVEWAPYQLRRLLLRLT